MPLKSMRKIAVKIQIGQLLYDPLEKEFGIITLLPYMLRGNKISEYYYVDWTVNGSVAHTENQVRHFKRSLNIYESTEYKSNRS